MSDQIFVMPNVSGFWGLESEDFPPANTVIEVVFKCFIVVFVVLGYFKA